MEKTKKKWEGEERNEVSPQMEGKNRSGGPDEREVRGERGENGRERNGDVKRRVERGERGEDRADESTVETRPDQIKGE